MKQDNNSLAHTTWNFKYHIVFAPKYRRQIQEDVVTDQLSLFEPYDPFAGEKNPKK